jgi:hypothetical protein
MQHIIFPLWYFKISHTSLSPCRGILCQPSQYACKVTLATFA